VSGATRAFLLGAMIVAACHHDAAGPTTPPVANKVTAPPPKKAVSDLALLPVDSEAVIGVDFGQLQQSALWQQYVVPRIGSVSVLDKFREVCGFDPLSSLKTVAMGLSHLGEAEPVGRVVLHGYDRKRSMTCFDKQVGNAAQDGSKIEIDGEVARVTDKDGKHVAFTFVDDATALVIVGPEAAQLARVQAIAAGEGGGLDGSAGFQELYSKIDTHQSVWMLFNGNSPTFQKTTQLGFHMKAFFGSIHVTAGLAADVRVRVSSPDEASSFAATAQGQISQLKQYFDKLDVTAEAADIHVAAAMTSEQIATLLQLLGGLGGGTGGP